jgi:hypothetical protein
MTGRAALPNWVAKRDGRLAPFDGDKICRALFAAGERLGRRNPFLARELTDGVLHFLAADGTDDPLPTDQLAEVITKVVRELGHPSLALTYEQYRTAKARRQTADHANRGAPLVTGAVGRLVADRTSAAALTRGAAAAALQSYTRQSVYPPDLLAAEQDGLLHFFDADTPLELTGGVVQPVPPSHRSSGPGWVEALEEARERVGQYVAIDGPEYALAALGWGRVIAAWVRELHIGLRLTGLRAVVNLNCLTPPAWASVEATGPLFAALAAADGHRTSDLCDGLLDHLLDGAPDGVRVDWHLGERDFEPAGRNRLLRLARRALDGASLGFVTDRPRRPVALSEGLNRQHTTVLCVVGVSLPRLAEFIGSGSGADPSAFLAKVGALARLALSAGHARREFLRSHAREAVTRGFEIDRARLVVVPLGLEEAVQQVTSQPATAGSPGLELARHVLHSLNAALRQDQTRGLAAGLDDAPPLSPLVDTAPSTTGAIGTPRQQLRAAGTLHTESEAGTAAVCLPADHRTTPEEVAHLLWYAWQQPGIVRVRFVRDVPVRHQLTAGWDIRSS